MKNFRSIYGLMVGIMASCLAASTVRGAGAVYCVRAGATGAGNGSDWNNAYPVLPNTLVRGSIYYVASGTYPGFTFNTAESGTSTVTVKKAVANDHGTSTGWSDNYGVGMAVFTNRLQITRSYFTLDGQTGGGPGSWTNGYGFKVEVLSTTSPTAGIYVSSNRKNTTLRHFEIQGNGGDGDAGGSGQANHALSIEVGTDQTTVSYAYLHDMGGCLIFGHGNNMFFEYVYGGRFESTSGDHAEIASLWAHVTSGAPGPVCTNVTFANCVWSHIEGTGGLIIQGDGIKIYGNTFYRPAGATFPSANGAIATWRQDVFVNARIYNNSFINLGSGFTSLGIGFGGTTGGNIVENNIFYNCNVDFGGVASHDYNLFITTSGTGASSEAHGATATSAIFNDYLGLDFTLKNNTPSGTDVGTPYDMDPRNVSRNTWTRGAYEFGSVAPSVPLKIQRVGNQLVFSWPDSATPFKLYGATSLTPSAVWTPITGAAVLSSGQWSLSMTTPALPRQFFRLQKQ